MNNFSSLSCDEENIYNQNVNVFHQKSEVQQESSSSSPPSENEHEECYSYYANLSNSPLRRNSKLHSLNQTQGVLPLFNDSSTHIQRQASMSPSMIDIGFELGEHNLVIKNQKDSVVSSPGRRKTEPSRELQPFTKSRFSSEEDNLVEISSRSKKIAKTIKQTHKTSIPKDISVLKEKLLVKKKFKMPFPNFLEVFQYWLRKRSSDESNNFEANWKCFCKALFLKRKHILEVKGKRSNGDYYRSFLFVEFLMAKPRWGSLYFTKTGNFSFAYKKVLVRDLIKFIPDTKIPSEFADYKMDVLLYCQTIDPKYNHFMSKKDKDDGYCMKDLMYNMLMGTNGKNKVDPIDWSLKVDVLFNTL